MRATKRISLLVWEAELQRLTGGTVGGHVGLDHEREILVFRAEVLYRHIS